MTDPPESAAGPRDHLLGTVVRVAPAAAWMVLIFWLSAQPVVPHPGRAYGIRDQVVDYTAHAGMFGVLAILAWWAIGHERILRSLPRTGRLGTALILAAIYAVLDELHQLAVPGRCATLPDLLADLVGIALAGALMALFERRRRPRSA